MDLNKRGIYTAVKVKDDWKALILFTNDGDAKEFSLAFVTEDHAHTFFEHHAPLLQKATNKAFKMAWDSQKFMYGNKNR
jgi:hypothetical protein